MEKEKIVSFDNELSSVSEGIDAILDGTIEMQDELSETEKLINEVVLELRESGVILCNEDSELCDEDVRRIDVAIDDLGEKPLAGDFHLSTIDIVTSIVAGIIASVIDIVFVGTPEVVKIYKGGENFDGSMLTAILRKVGNGDGKFSEMLEWLSHKCTVPYNVSLEKGVVIPNNHRLRNPGHDPLFGLLFAIADIILGTATLVDNDGNLRIIVRDKEYPPHEKYLAVIYYLGHLLSDMCTARGLPIPGFIATQFFSSGDDKEGIASIAEQMYKDGYDSRHLISMSAPVVVKNMIIDAYLILQYREEKSQIESIAEKEIRINRRMAYKYRMRLVSDAVSCSGNAMKFFLPPTSGNITALNLPEWVSLIQNSLAELMYQSRDKKVEETLINRETIRKNWEKLLESI